MTRIVVTGATSYLGGKVVSRLLSAGHDVIALVRSTSDLSGLRAMNRPPIIEVLDGRTERICEIFAAMTPECVCHLAGQYRRAHTATDVTFLNEAILQFGTQVLEAMRSTDCRHIVTLGSYFQFMDGTGQRAVNLYAAMKQSFENILDFYSDAYGIAAARIILFDVYGEDDPRRKFITVLRDAILSGAPMPLPDDDVEIDLLHVDDVAAAVAHAVERRIVGGPYALRSGSATSLENLISIFEDESGTNIGRQRGAIHSPERRPSRIWDGPPLPGWKPAIPLTEGIRRMLGNSLS